jgi:integral membrane sensor domain MASE1
MPHAEQHTEGSNDSGLSRLAGPGRMPSVWWWAALTASLYFVAAFAAIYWSHQPGAVASLWFANSIAVMLMSTRNQREWPVLLVSSVLGNVCANLAVGDNLPMSVAFVPANAAEVLLGALLMRRFCDARAAISDAVALLRTVLLAGFVPALLGAVIGAATLDLKGVAPFAKVWFTWFEGGAIGAAAGDDDHGLISAVESGPPGLSRLKDFFTRR